MKINALKITILLAVAFALSLLTANHVDAQGSGYPTTSINVTDFSFTPSTIDSTNSSQTVTITVRVTDTERDIWNMYVLFRSPVIGHQLGFESQDRISGNARDGVYRKAFTFAQYSDVGTWVVSYIHVLDGTPAYYRWRELDTFYLAARGFPTQLQVINNNEAVPPEITDFNFTPSTLGDSRNVTVTLRARDEASGVSSIDGSFSYPPDCYVYDDDCISIGFGFTSADRISGDNRDGVYRRVFNISPAFPPGIYAANVRASDGVRNYARLRSADLAALGFPFQLRINDVVNVANIEELYSAVNNPQNAGMQILIAPGVYMLSVNDPNGAARPNSGRIELQQNMSLQGIVGDRGAVIIDAINLPLTSFNSAAPIPLTGAIRMGRGSNSLEWLTVRNAVNGAANVETELASAATSIRIAHIASTNSQRGIDVRSFGTAQAGRVIEAEIIDNDLYNNRIGALGEGLRIVNNQGANGGRITAILNGNRSYYNYNGLIVENNRSNNANISVVSSGDQIFENGLGALVGAGLSAVSTVANGNTVNFTANGSSFENNNGFNNFDFGGLVVIAGENTSIPNGTSNNTVNVELRNCRFGNNQLYDIGAFGARSKPVSVGLPGTNNRVSVRLYSTGVPVLVTDDSIPDNPGGMNSVVISRPSFDFDHDGRTELSIFRPSNRTWYLQGGLGGFTAMQFGEVGDLIAPADYDGDGKTDVAVFRPSNGIWYIFNSGSQSFTTIGWGANGDLPIPADHDGDGKADLVLFRPSTNTWYTRFANGTLSTTAFGSAGDKPVVGDFDGDGKSDIAVFRASDNNWYILKTGFGFFVQTWGAAGDIPAPADYDGDGKTDLAVFRPSTGQWFRALSATGADTLSWGVKGDKPIPADYDGDGKSDVAVFRPSNSTWYIVGSTSGQLIQNYGVNGDVPTQGAFIY